jgi:hypothetical protein
MLCRDRVPVYRKRPLKYIIFPPVAQKRNSVSNRLIVEVSISHTIRHTQPVGLPWQSDQLVPDAAIYTTQHTKETNIHALSGIRTLGPNNRAAAECA